MSTSIIIEQEMELKGRWLRIHIPYDTRHISMATIQKTDGTTLKKVNLFEGNNSIDISQLAQETLKIKIETPLETILKEI